MTMHNQTSSSAERFETHASENPLAAEIGRVDMDAEEGSAYDMIGRYITTDDGYTFEVVDVEIGEWDTYYVVRSDLDGNDMARSGECGVDWEYVHIPVSEARKAS